LEIYPTHRVVMGRREVTDEVLHAFAVTELEGPPAQVEEALRRVPAETIAFAVWRGAGRPALLCTLRDRGAVGMAMMGTPAPLRAVDAAVLEAVVLAPLLGLLDPAQFATTESIQYVRELGAATALVDQGEASAAFLLRAPTRCGRSPRRARSCRRSRRTSSPSSSAASCSIRWIDWLWQPVCGVRE